MPISARSCALEALRRLGRPALTSEVARVAGYTPRRMRTILPELAREGVVRAVPTQLSRGGHAITGWRLA